MAPGKHVCAATTIQQFDDKSAHAPLHVGVCDRRHIPANETSVAFMILTSTDVTSVTRQQCDDESRVEAPACSTTLACKRVTSVQRRQSRRSRE